MQRIVNAEAKAGLKLSTIVRNLDIYCFKGHHLIHNTSSKVQTQGSNNKGFFCFEKPKPKDLKPAPPRDNAVAEPVKKKDKKNKKKRFQRQK